MSQLSPPKMLDTSAKQAVSTSKNFGKPRRTTVASPPPIGSIKPWQLALSAFQLFCLNKQDLHKKGPNYIYIAIFKAEELRPRLAFWISLGSSAKITSSDRPRNRLRVIAASCKIKPLGKPGSDVAMRRLTKWTMGLACTQRHSSMKNQRNQRGKFKASKKCD